MKETYALTASSEQHHDSQVLALICPNKCFTHASLLLRASPHTKIQLKYCIAIDHSALTTSFSLEWLIHYTQNTGENQASSMQHYCCLTPAPRNLAFWLSEVRPEHLASRKLAEGMLCRRWKLHLILQFLLLPFIQFRATPLHWCFALLPLPTLRKPCGIKILNQNLNIWSDFIRSGKAI